MKIGILGTGAIGAPMARFLADRGHDVWVSQRNADRAAELAASHGVRVASNQDVVDAVDVVALCLRPQVARDTLTPLTFRADQQVISVMAAVPLADLCALCSPVPATSFVQTIPFEYLDKGGCPLPAFGSHALLAELFEPDNTVIPVASEPALNAHFAACTVLPAVLDLMATGADWLGEQTGDRSAAQTYLRYLITGYLHARGGDLADERDALATEGTLSLQMTSALRVAGTHRALTQALGAIANRLAPADPAIDGDTNA